MLITELKRENLRLYGNFVRWLDDLIFWEDPKHSHGKERDEIVKLILEENGWVGSVWRGVDLEEELQIFSNGADRLELGFKVIRNEVYVCFKGPIKIDMIFYPYVGKGSEVLDFVFDVDFKIKVFNSIEGGEILEDIYLELFTEQR